MGRGIAFSDCGITAGLVRQRSGFPAVTPKGERLRDALTSHEAECGRFAGFRAFEAWKHRQAQRDRANKRWGNAGNGSSGNAAAMQGTGTVKGTVKEVREKLATDEREIANLRRISRRYEEADRAAGGAG